MECEGDPLDIKKIETLNKLGHRKVVNAIHIGFAEKREYVLYQKPSVYFDAVAIEEWLAMMDAITEDINWLLSLPYHRFWSQIIYDSDLIQFLDDILSKMPRFYDLEDNLTTDEMKIVISRLHNKLFKVYLRMSTYKESKNCHISPQYFGGIIYEKFLFDIPKLMDLCAIYGKGNCELLTKMIKNIFSVQDEYFADLEKVVEAFMQILSDIEETHFKKEECLMEPRKLDDNFISSSLSSLTLKELSQLIMRIVDASVTLSLFFEFFTSGSMVYKKPNQIIVIAYFYSNTFPKLKKELQSRSSDEDEALIKKLFHRLSLSKKSLIDAFHYILYSSCIAPLLNRPFINEPSLSCQEACIEDYINVVHSVLCDKTFICDYQKKYPIEEDLEIFSQSRYAPDPARISFILNTLYSVYGKNIPDRFLNMGALESTSRDHNSSSSNYNRQEYSHLEGACASPAMKDDVELDSLICSVKDLLPEYGEGFLEQCLHYYNYNSENVINALLERQLPPELEKLDKKMGRHKRSSPNFFDSPPLNNAYENDHLVGLDIEVPAPYQESRIRNDSLSEEAKKTIIQRYGFVDDSALYEDEYDDTYDSVNLGADVIDDKKEEEGEKDEVERGERRSRKAGGSSRNKEPTSLDMSDRHTYKFVDESEQESQNRLSKPSNMRTFQNSRHSKGSSPQKQQTRGSTSRFSSNSGHSGNSAHTKSETKAQENSNSHRPQGQNNSQRQKGQSSKGAHSQHNKNHNRRANHDRKMMGGFHE